jgi:hypothetical protein
MIVKAWAVVCANGKIHIPHEGPSYLFPDGEDVGPERIALIERMMASFKCGPHVVVPLIGEVKR